MAKSRFKIFKIYFVFVYAYVAHMKPEANMEQLILSLSCVWFQGMELSV